MMLGESSLPSTIADLGALGQLFGEDRLKDAWRLLQELLGKATQVQADA